MPLRLVKVKTKGNNLVLIDVSRIVALNLTLQYVFLDGDGTPFELSDVSFGKLLELVGYPFETDDLTK